jgi:hypothetical protein
MTEIILAKMSIAAISKNNTNNRHVNSNRTVPDPKDPDNIFGWMSEETREDLRELAYWCGPYKGYSRSRGGVKLQFRDRRSSSKGLGKKSVNYKY